MESTVTQSLVLRDRGENRSDVSNSEEFITNGLNVLNQMGEKQRKAQLATVDPSRGEQLSLDTCGWYRYADM